MINYIRNLTLWREWKVQVEVWHLSVLTLTRPSSNWKTLGLVALAKTAGNNLVLGSTCGQKRTFCIYLHILNQLLCFSQAPVNAEKGDQNHIQSPSFGDRSHFLSIFAVVQSEIDNLDMLEPELAKRLVHYPASLVFDYKNTQKKIASQVYIL